MNDEIFLRAIVWTQTFIGSDKKVRIFKLIMLQNLVNTTLEQV